MALAEEEIFGPILPAIPYNSEAQAIEIGSGTSHGLSGGVSSFDQDRKNAVVHQLDTWAGGD